MKPKDAVALENLWPTTSYVESRGGFASHATGMTGTGKTLATYNALTGTNKMLCFTEQGVYNVTSAGAVGASLLARTNGKHQWVNFGDGTNNYLIAPNGVDAPFYYDGTTATAVTGATSPALTGVTTTELVSVFVSKGRLYFIQKSSLSFWYLAAGAAGGALTEFDLSAEAPAGGYLMAGGSWTFDGGDGIDDYVVFMTSEGEAIIYRGTNPSSAATWAKVGTYQIGKPLGRRCLTKYGGDIIVLTQNGAFPLSAATATASVDSKLALSFKIENAFNDASRLYSSNFGWKSILYPAKSAFIVNVPKTEDGDHEQYVMNTITKAWCKFTEWDAEDFAVFNSELYFCDGSVVYKAWTGTVDGTSDIILYAKQAFSDYGMPGVQKHVSGYQPVLGINGTLSFLTDIDVDFKDTPITGTATYTVATGATWDTSLWDTGVWGSGLQIAKEWTSPDEWTGVYVSGKIKIATDTLTVQWYSSNLMFTAGGPL